MRTWIKKTCKVVVLGFVASAFALGSVASAGQCTNERWKQSNEAR